MTESLELTRWLPGPPWQVFRMWTDPVLMRLWLLVSDAETLTRVVADPVVGGRYSVLEWNGRIEIDHFGRYVEVDA